MLQAGFVCMQAGAIDVNYSSVSHQRNVMLKHNYTMIMSNQSDVEL